MIRGFYMPYDEKKFLEIKKRKIYPTDEVEPENFLDNDTVMELLKNKQNYKFEQKDMLKLFNCVHCNKCGISEERIKLNEKFLEDGNTIENLDEMIADFEQFGTPYPTNKMRIRRPEGIPKKSDTLFFMGCLSTIRVPRYTEHALKYLMKKKIDFTILSQEICCGYPLLVSGAKDEFLKVQEKCMKQFTVRGFKKVICLCPACYFVFKEHYPDTGIEFTYISDYLGPADSKKTGEVSIQHLCQLMNRGREGVELEIEKDLRDSGFDVVPVPHWCCGGGLGYMHRTEVIDKIATLRIHDFDQGDYYTTYCPSCYWTLKTFGKREKIAPKLKDLFELLL